MFSPAKMKVTFGLAIANLVVFVLTSFLSDRVFSTFAFSTFAMDYGRWWTLFTSMFMHSGWSHIINNMISLIFVGSRLEPRLGTARYLAIYLLSGVAAGFMFYIVSKISGDPSLVVGASGAIFGLFGAYGFFIFKNHMKYGRADGSPVTEIQVAIYAFFMLENVVYGLADSSVANSEHIGGLICGVLLARFLVNDSEI